ncbi:unnamed protein product [Rotaria sp. Silwood2]|nr:unnamed protein product [Rotaria sp. Silwood2]
MFDTKCTFLTIGTNETNQTVAIDTAREYLEALYLISRRSYSYFNLTLLNVIFVIILLSIAIIISLISIRVIYLSSSSCHQRKLRKNRNDSHTLYRLQGPTETQLPLLDNGPGEISLTSSLNITGNSKSSQDENVNHSLENDEQQQQLLYQLDSKSSSIVKISNEYKTFTLNSNHNTYDILSDNRHSDISRTLSYPHVRDSGYETTSSNIDQQRFLLPASPTNVSSSTDNQLIAVTYFSSSIPTHQDLSLSSPNSVSRTLKTFAHMPTANITGNESSTMMMARLAEQEIIEV